MEQRKSFQLERGVYTACRCTVKVPKFSDLTIIFLDATPICIVLPGRYYQVHCSSSPLK
jgi:hypothetical protein